MLQGDYYLINEQEKTVEFFFSHDLTEPYFKYPLGRLLVDFLNLDLTEFENVRLQYEDFIKHPTKEKYDSIPHNSDFFSNDFYQQIESKQHYSQSLYLFLSFFFVQRNKLPHPFTKVFPYYVNYYYQFSIEELLNDKFNLLYQQNCFKELVDFCFNTTKEEIYKNLNPKQLIAVYLNASRFDSHWLNDMNLYKTYQLFPTSEEVNLKFYNERKGNLYPRSINKSFLKDISKIPFDIKEVFSCFDIPSFLFTEAMKVIELGISIRKCKNCHQYFVVKRKLSFYIL